jgi:ribosome-interacting GTPase 1
LLNRSAPGQAGVKAGVASRRLCGFAYAMPANLTPEYERADRRFREARTDAERIAALQEMLSTIPKHKGTEKMQADLKRRLSQLRRDEQAAAAHPKGPDPFHIPKRGAGQVVLAGPPNAGKSSLLAATTHAPAHIAEYPFTTTVPQPGIWIRAGVPIELVDTPPFTPEHMPTGLLGTLRNADLLCLVVDATQSAPDQIELALAQLHERDLVLRTVPRNVLATHEANLRPGLVVANKAEAAPPANLDAARALYAPALEVLAVSAQTRLGLDAWFDRLWDLLAMIRVYAKEPGQPPDLGRPFTLPAGATVADLARHIHRNLPETMKFARLWGHSRFAGQQVHKNEPLQDNDIVEIRE